MASSARTADTAGNEPQVVAVPKRTTAVVTGDVPVSELPAFFDRAFGLLGQVIGAQQVAVDGPAFALYRRPPEETADLEVGFVTSDPVESAGEVTPSSLPGGRVARLVHHGAYDELGSAWEQLRSWIAAQGLTPAPVMWEFYVTEPSPDMDPADLRTELNWPVMQ